MVKYHVPTVIISAFATEGARATFDALRYGAIDAIARPSKMKDRTLDSQSEEIVKRVKRAASIGIGRSSYTRRAKRPDQSDSPSQGSPDHETRFIGIVAGTGGYYSMLRIIPSMDNGFNDVIIASLAAPSNHVRAFIAYLAAHSLIPVEDALEADTIRSGVCYVCARDDHLIIEEGQRGELMLSFHEPSSKVGQGPADRFLSSLAAAAGENVVGVLMSGRAADGPLGAEHIRKMGGVCVVQDPNNCMDPGLPEAVHRKTTVDLALPDFLMADFFMRGSVAPDRPKTSSNKAQRNLSPSAALQEDFCGYVDKVDIIEYLQFVLLSGKPTVLEVFSESGETGRIFARNGNVVHAVCRQLEGEEALFRCLGFRGGKFVNRPWSEPAKITVHRPGDYLIMEAARRRDDILAGIRFEDETEDELGEWIDW
jgi:two-component system chemotaxis response regulator CheB